MNLLEKIKNAMIEEQNRGFKLNIQNKDDKVKAFIKQNGEEVLKWLLTAIYLVLLIYFALKPLTEFFMMIEYYLKVNIINFYFAKQMISLI